MTTELQTRHLNWNVQSGGYAAYDLQLETPVRAPLIQDVLRMAKHDYGVTSATLTDAHRWDETYGGEQGIADHTGFTSARYTRLDDTRLSQDNGKGIGIAFATDKKIAKDWTIDLKAQERKALGVVLDIGKYGLQLANCYLDDLDEDVRKAQMAAMIDQLEPGMPTVLVGDNLGLAADATGAQLHHKITHMGVRLLAMLPSSSGLFTTIRGLNRREVLPLAEERGYVSADPLKRPTAPSRLPAFQVDHMLANSGVEVSDFQVLRGAHIRRASDHLLQVATLGVK